MINHKKFAIDTMVQGTKKLTILRFFSQLMPLFSIATACILLLFTCTFFEEPEISCESKDYMFTYSVPESEGTQYVQFQENFNNSETDFSVYAENSKKVNIKFTWLTDIDRGDQYFRIEPYNEDVSINPDNGDITIESSFPKDNIKDYEVIAEVNRPKSCETKRSMRINSGVLVKTSLTLTVPEGKEQSIRIADPDDGEDIDFKLLFSKKLAMDDIAEKIDFELDLRELESNSIEKNAISIEYSLEKESNELYIDVEDSKPSLFLNQVSNGENTILVVAKKKGESGKNYVGALTKKFEVIVNPSLVSELGNKVVLKNGKASYTERIEKVEGQPTNSIFPKWKEILAPAPELEVIYRLEGEDIAGLDIDKKTGELYGSTDFAPTASAGAEYSIVVIAESTVHAGSISFDIKIIKIGNKCDSLSLAATPRDTDEDGVYEINYWKELLYLSLYNQASARTEEPTLADSYILTKYIELPHLACEESFSPIGYALDSNKRVINTIFTGSFDGNDQTISSLFICEQNVNFVGLFSKLAGGENSTEPIVKNLTLQDAIVKATNNVGSLAGELKSGIVSKVHTKIKKDDNKSDKNLCGSTMNVGTVEAAESVGGLIGIVGESGKLEASSSDYTVVGSIKNMGGLVGTANDSKINGRFTGKVKRSSTRTGENIGGLVGFAKNSDIWGDVDDNYVLNVLTVRGRNKTGGLVGLLTENSTVWGYFVGSVDGETNVGGLVGEATESKVYGYAKEGGNTPMVAGRNNTGGLVGRTEESTVTGYLIGSIEGNNNAGGLVGNAESTSSIFGYAKGEISSNDISSSKRLAGGLVGTLTKSKVVGYARNKIILGDRPDEGQYGRVLGVTSKNFETVWKFVYSSEFESVICSGGEYRKPTDDSVSGKSINITSETNVDGLKELLTVNNEPLDMFNDDGEGKVWKLKEGHWPAIILPAEVGENPQFDNTDDDPTLPASGADCT